MKSQENYSYMVVISTNSSPSYIRVQISISFGEKYDKKDKRYWDVFYKCHKDKSPRVPGSHHHWFRCFWNYKHFHSCPFLSWLA
ncbi:hypothetical protein S245_055591, partial [Arachis hypogaea]